MQHSAQSLTQTQSWVSERRTSGCTLGVGLRPCAKHWVGCCVVHLGRTLSTVWPFQVSPRMAKHSTRLQEAFPAGGGESGHFRLDQKSRGTRVWEAGVSSSCCTGTKRHLYVVWCNSNTQIQLGARENKRKSVLQDSRVVELFYCTEWNSRGAEGARTKFGLLSFLDP